MAKKSKSSAENANVCAGLAYLLVGIIWYFVDEKMRKDALVTSHVKQALVLFIVSLAGSLILGITIIGIFLIPIFNLVVFVFAIIQMIAAFQGNEKELPLVGKYGEKFTF